MGRAERFALFLLKNNELFGGFGNNSYICTVIKTESV